MTKISVKSLSKTHNSEFSFNRQISFNTNKKKKKSGSKEIKQFALTIFLVHKIVQYYKKYTFFANYKHA